MDLTPQPQKKARTKLIKFDYTKRITFFGLCIPIVDSNADRRLTLVSQDNQPLLTTTFDRHFIQRQNFLFVIDDKSHDFVLIFTSAERCKSVFTKIQKATNMQPNPMDEYLFKHTFFIPILNAIQAGIEGAEELKADISELMESFDAEKRLEYSTLGFKILLTSPAQQQAIGQQIMGPPATVTTNVPAEVHDASLQVDDDDLSIVDDSFTDQAISDQSMVTNNVRAEVHDASLPVDADTCDVHDFFTDQAISHQSTDTTNVPAEVHDASLPVNADACDVHDSFTDQAINHQSTFTNSVRAEVHDASLPVNADSFDILDSFTDQDISHQNTVTTNAPAEEHGASLPVNADSFDILDSFTILANTQRRTPHDTPGDAPPPPAKNRKRKLQDVESDKPEEEQYLERSARKRVPSHRIRFNESFDGGPSSSTEPNSSSTSFENIVNPLDYKLYVKPCQGRMSKRLFIFDSTDRTSGYEYQYHKKGYYYCYHCQKSGTYVSAIRKTGSDGEYIVLRNKNHTCAPKIFDGEQEGVDDSVVQQNDASISMVRNESLNNSGRIGSSFLADMDSRLDESSGRQNDSLLSTSSVGNRSLNGSCTVPANYLSILMDRSNTSASRQNVSLLFTSNVAEENRIIRLPNYKLYEKERNGRMYSRLFVYDSSDRSRGYDFGYDRSHGYSSYYCYECRYQFKTSTTAKLVKDANGDYIQFGTQGHKCSPKLITAELRAMFLGAPSVSSPAVNNNASNRLPTERRVVLHSSSSPSASSPSVNRNGRVTILRKPFFKVYDKERSGILYPRIFIYDATNRAIGYDFGFDAKLKIFYCLACRKMTHRVCAKLDDKNGDYVELGANQHRCKPKAFDERRSSQSAFHQDDSLVSIPTVAAERGQSSIQQGNSPLSTSNVGAGRSQSNIQSINSSLSISNVGAVRTQSSVQSINSPLSASCAERRQPITQRNDSSLSISNVGAERTQSSIPSSTSSPLSNSNVGEANRILRLPDYKLYKKKHQGMMRQRLFVYDSSDRSRGYDLCFHAQRNHFYCNDCKVNHRAIVKAWLKEDSDGNYIELGPVPHQCNLKPVPSDDPL